ARSSAERGRLVEARVNFPVLHAPEVARLVRDKERRERRCRGGAASSGGRGIVGDGPPGRRSAKPFVKGIKHVPPPVRNSCCTRPLELTRYFSHVRSVGTLRNSSTLVTG